MQAIISTMIKELHSAMSKINAMVKTRLGRFRHVNLFAAKGLAESIEYRIGNILIHLPADHQLPVYQKLHRQYDSFLPYFAKALPKGGLVIDVGANCGDTLCAMIQQNENLNFLCVEADSDFYEYLMQNIIQIKAETSCASIAVVKAFVGKDLANVKMAGSGGTKKACTSPFEQMNSLKAESLDSITSRLDIALESLTLLKIDTDGFDYDVLNSAKSLLRRLKPFVFFECQCDNIDQKNEYFNIIKWLSRIGYCKWVVFDNFGAVMMRTTDYSLIFDLVEYVWRQGKGLSTRTFYYIDILAATQGDAESLDHAIDGYNSEESLNNDSLF